MTDFEMLAKVSELAKKRGNNYKLIDIRDFDGFAYNDESLSFHPNGKCGCIELDDSNIFGIRCNHLIWAEGWCEGVEDFWSNSFNGVDESDADADIDIDEREADVDYEAILVFGNHKGELVAKLIAFQPKLV